jgi:hypothetical protein
MAILNISRRVPMNKLVCLVALVGLIAVAALLLVGCAAKEATHPLSSYVVPDFTARAVKTIAILPIADRTVSTDASDTVLRFLRPHVSTMTAYRFLSEEDVLGLAQSKNVSDAYNALLSGWRKKGDIGTQDAISVGQAVGADALLLTEVNIWIREWVEPNTRGASQTQVGIRMLLVSSKNGEKLWEASDEQVVRSIEYDPASKIGVHVDDTGRATALYGGIPQPPTFDEVAPRVMEAIFKVFP